MTSKLLLRFAESCGYTVDTADPGFPRQYTKALGWVENYVPPRYQEAEANFPFTLSRNWYLWGPVGTGKTHTAYALVRLSCLRAVIHQAPLVRVVNFPKEVMRYHTAPFAVKEEIYQTLTAGKPLIIDDLGAERLDQHGRSTELLMVALNERVEQEVWTGFTSNKRIKDLPYDDRLKSRLVGMCKGNIHQLTGTDHRTTQTQEDDS